MRIVPVAPLLIAAFATAQTASGQNLAEAAAKEKERRRASQAAAKVYTEGDLGKGGKGTFSAPSGPDSSAVASDAAPKDGAATPGPAGKKEKTPDELKAEQEKAWRDKLQKANDDITRISARIDALQRAVNDLSQNLYNSARTSQLNELEEAKKQLADTQQTLADLQDEGRRNGFR